MPGFDLGLFARNTARALLFVFPLLLASIWVTAQWFGDGGDGWAAGALYYFLTLGAPIVLGAVLHQLVLTVVGRAEFARDRLRVIALVLVVIFPAAFLLVGSRAEIVMHPAILVPLLIGGCAYALTMKFVRAPG